MFRKSIIMALVIATSTQSFAALSTEDGDSLLTRMQKQVFEWVYFGTIAAPFGVVTEFVGTQKEKAKVRDAQADAEFFQTHVVAAEKGELTQNIYKKVVIKVSAADVVTQSVFIDANKSTARHDVAVDSSSGTIVVDNYNAVFIKINSRDLISDKLAEAHMAAQNLIWDDVIVVPDHLRPTDNKENTHAAATNAVVLNELMLDYIHSK